MCFIIGLVYLLNRVKFVRNAIVIKGKVVDLKRDSINYKKAYFPVVSYIDDMGKRRTFESDAGYNRSIYNIGDEVELKYYRMGKKRKVSINTVFALYGVSLVFMPIGLLFVVIGVLGEIL